MTFCVESEWENTLPFSTEETGRLVAKKVLEQENCPFPCVVNVLLTSDESVRELNKEHRGIDAATDVLSFPALSFEQPAGFPAPDMLEPGAKDPETGEVWLGDIVISMDRVLRQAEAFGHSVRREYAFLIAHSMLHLSGYDHVTEEESRVMEAHTEQVLAALHITRDTDS